MVLSNASAQAIRKAQSAFSGAAEAMGISSEDDVQALVNEVRYGKDGKMRELVDTNILFSALVFPRSRPAQALLHVADNHEMVLCDRNITELRDILGRKAPKFLPDAEVLLAE